MTLSWVFGEGSWNYEPSQPREMRREIYEVICSQERAAAQANARTAMPDNLPPAEVTVTTPDYNKVNVNIKREGARERNYVGSGTSEIDRTTDAFKKYLDDPAGAEYIRRG